MLDVHIAMFTSVFVSFSLVSFHPFFTSFIWNFLWFLLLSFAVTYYHLSGFEKRDQALQPDPAFIAPLH